MTEEHAERALTPRQREIALWILRRVRGVPDVRNLVAQVDRAAVVAERSTPTRLDLEVPSEMPRSAVPDGRVPVHAVLMDQPYDIEGEVFLLVRDGLISGLEYVPYLDSAPTEWPLPTLLIEVGV